MTNYASYFRTSLLRPIQSECVKSFQRFHLDGQHIALGVELVSKVYVLLQELGVLLVLFVKAK